MLQLDADIWIIVKAMFLIGMALYLVFGLIVVRQVWHMTNTLRVGFETPLKLFSLIHLIASLGLFFFALMYL